MLCCTANQVYQWSYQTESVTVLLAFSRRQCEESDDAYRLISITLEKKFRHQNNKRANVKNRPFYKNYFTRFAVISIGGMPPMPPSMVMESLISSPDTTPL